MRSALSQLKKQQKPEKRISVVLLSIHKVFAF